MGLLCHLKEPNCIALVCFPRNLWTWNTSTTSTRVGDPRKNRGLLQALERFGGRPPLEGDRVSRYLIENFLQKNRVLPRKWMAARMGLRCGYFDRLLPQVQTLMPRGSYIVHEELIDESLIDDCVTNLPGLRFRTFTDHESFCSRLHEAVSQELGISLQTIHDNSLWCATDQWLAEAPVMEIILAASLRFSIASPVMPSVSRTQRGWTLVSR